MIHAAGILFVCNGKGLFLRRGNGADHPNEWCIPGGKLEGEETPEQGAIRETFEEAGVSVSPHALKPWIRTIAPAETPMEQATVATPAIEGDALAPSEDVDFTTFIVRLENEFTPTLCDEHDGYAWAPLTAPPLPIHPGVRVALDRLDMDELGVARAIAAGRLCSPQRYENVWLFAIRITGTGVSYRHSRKEFVWRDPAVYLNDDFLARCNGLPVIWEHPVKSLLNHVEFHKRKVGTVFVPFIPTPEFIEAVPKAKADEVWAIAKVYDDKAAAFMDRNVMSTSPAVNFADPGENNTITLENGKVMLIEGKPSLLDHIAICEQGVWDKGGDPTGVESVNAIADSVPVPKASRLDPDKLDLLRLSVGAFAFKTNTQRYS